MVPELSPQTNKAIALSYSAIGASLGHQVAEKLTGNNHLLLSLKKKEQLITCCGRADMYFPL
jgi:hypothetical protein